MIETRADFDSIRIYYDGALHVWLKRAHLCSIQSWRCGEKHYSIEYTLKYGGTMLTEYDNEEKWRAVLGELDKAGVL